MTDAPNGVIDELVEFQEDYTDSSKGTQLVIKRTQEIPQEYLDSLKEQRDAPFDKFGNRMVRAASIPISIIHKWDREGYPWEEIMREPRGIQKILAKLDQESLDKFITTRKTI